MSVQQVEMVRCDRCKGKMDGPSRFTNSHPTIPPLPKVRVLVLHQPIAYPADGEGEPRLAEEEMRAAAEHTDLCDKCQVLVTRLVTKIAGTYKPKMRKTRTKKSASAEGGDFPKKAKGGRQVGGTRDVAANLEANDKGEVKESPPAIAPSSASA